MRMALAAFVGALGVLGLTATAQAAGGCGPGFHRTAAGHCLSFHRGVMMSRFSTSPSDHSANRLNADELSRIGSGQ